MLAIRNQGLYPSRENPSHRHIPQSAERTLDAPDLVDDYYLNLLDWSVNNVLSIALGNIVYLWDASDSSISELLTVDEDDGPVTSVSWASSGKHIAVGLNNSAVQLWDSESNKQLRTLEGHRARVGALAWNGPILSTGGRDEPPMGALLQQLQGYKALSFGKCLELLIPRRR